jgi:oligopeptide/dipeptide ABC transporter ATP-binding protein
VVNDVSDASGTPPILDVRHLTTAVRGRDPGGRPVIAVDNISFRVDAGRVLAIVGESGSGKSITCLSLLGLLPSSARLIEGEVRFKGRDIARLSPAELQQLRGRSIGMVLQDAMTSLNPLMTIGEQVGEVFRYHRGITDRRELERLSVEALETVKIPAARERLASYPFQFSGGMRQRVALAINIALSPELLICDEPTTALDVTVQLQILTLLRELQRDRGIAIVFVTHDLHLAAQFCDDVAVMYAGRIVESGPIGEVLERPVHPYTVGLVQAAPSLANYRRPLAAIPGQQPALGNLPPGCRFEPRCPSAVDACRQAYPDWFEFGARHVACWLTEERIGATPMAAAPVACAETAR